MKVLITHAYYLADDANEQRILMPYPPLGMLYISAYLEQEGIQNIVFDSTFESEETLFQHLKNEQPDIVCVYANMVTKPNIVRLMQFIKTSELLKKTKILLGGPDIRYNKENYLKHGADYVIIGEGEVTTFKLIKSFSNYEPVDGINGIAFINSDGKIISTPERNLALIEELPFPARHKINMDLYFQNWKDFHGYRSINISTMRGCPYSCRWCSKAVYGKTSRRRSTVSVINEIELLQKKYNFENIWFVDDVFTLQKQWLTEFADELGRRNIVIRYECITRADQLTEIDIGLLKQTGCYRVWIGAESGSQKIIDLMERCVKIVDVQKAIISVKNAEIQAGTFIMLGYPGETEKDIMATLKHLKRSNPDLYTITLTYPITGTELYDEVKFIDSKKKKWAELIDREIDFERTYPRTYYQYAIKFIQREMACHKALGNRNLIDYAKHKLFALYHRLKMKQILIFGNALVQFRIY